MSPREELLREFWRSPEPEAMQALFTHLLAEGPTCPLCYVEGDFELRCVGRLQWEAAFRAAKAGLPVDAWDLCNHHAWSFKEWVSPAVNAAVFETLLREVSRALDGVAADAGGGPDEASEALGDARRCPVCNELARVDTSLVGGFAAALADPAFREVFAASRGLCVPHIQGVLARLTGEAARAFLAVCRTHLDQLAADLREYREKTSRLDHDYGDLKAVPLQAIRRWAGNRGRNAWQGERSDPRSDEPPRSE